MTGGLHCVGVEQHAALTANCTNLRNGKNGADFIVGVHHGDQAGILADGVRDLLRGDGANAADGQQLNLKAFFFEPFQRVQHRVMLKGSGNDVHFALALAETGRRNDGLIVCLAAAGGEIDLARRSI